MSSFDQFPLFVSVLAGSGSVGFKDGPRAVAIFRHPKAVALNPQNTTNLFVADRDNSCIRLVNTLIGEVKTIAGKGSSAGFVNGVGNSALFNKPEGILVYFDDIIVSDSQNFVLRKISKTINVTTFSGSGIQGHLDGDAKVARYGYPTGLDYDPKTGYIIVGDGDYNYVRQVYPNGSVITIAGTGQKGNQNGPALQATFDWISDVKFHPSGTIFIADSYYSFIRKLENGVVTTFAGNGSGYMDGPLSSARFSNGNGFAFDGDGSLIFSDLGNHLIRMVKNNANVITIAGMLKPTRNLNGIALNSTFNNPGLLAIDNNARILYVADDKYSDIKMICSAPCYNRGIYDCFTKICYCIGKWSGPNCLNATTTTASMSKTKSFTTESVTQINQNNTPMDAVTVTAISLSVGLIFVSLGIILIMRYRRRTSKIPVNSSSSRRKFEFD
jgi:hypothetical protein